MNSTGFASETAPELRRPITAKFEWQAWDVRSGEWLRQYATTLAVSDQTVVSPTYTRALTHHLWELRRNLSGYYQFFIELIEEGVSHNSLQVCLVDNFHTVEEQLHEIGKDLPNSLSEVPSLATGEYARQPRVYAIAKMLVSVTEGNLGGDAIKRILSACQKDHPLSIKELWSMPTLLRLALIERLERLVRLTFVTNSERGGNAGLHPGTLSNLERRSSATLTDRLNTPHIESGKILQFIKLLYARKAWDQVRDNTFFSFGSAKQSSNGRALVEAAESVTFKQPRQGNALAEVEAVIRSMRLLSALDWSGVFESVSRVDRILSEDPADVYTRMDFETRDRYRKVIERLSKQTSLSESDIASRAVEMARQAKEDDPQYDRRSHVGYYLIGDGLTKLQDTLAYRPSPSERLVAAIKRRPTSLYLGTIGVLSVTIDTLAALGIHNLGANGTVLIILTLITLLPASVLAIDLTHLLITWLIKPQAMPKMDTTSGIPESEQTMVVIPALLTSDAVVRESLRKLELHFLATRDDNIAFAILSDYSDASAAEMPGDSVLLETALDGIEQLNSRYCEHKPPCFHLFHRRRQWNKGEGKWIGWERKRGKLHEFNRLARGAQDTSFVVATADQQYLSKIKFVITLDADTHLPRDAARRLIGVITHPLNRPFFDERTGRVTSGYAVLQPRVSISLASASRSLFSRIHSGDSGIDPYTSAGSNVYQDMFSEGIYTGKGLYEIDAFMSALHSRTPDNSTLSHDLIEGLFSRTALVSEIQVFDDYPASYESYSKRLHRWTRGDWQTARWLFPSVRDARGRMSKNSLPLISRWKITDNLRRSLVMPATLLLLVLAWTSPPATALFVTFFTLCIHCLPPFFHIVSKLLSVRGWIKNRGHLRSVRSDLMVAAAQVAFTIAFLAHQAYLMTDAVARAVYRQMISRKLMLEWATAAHVEEHLAKDNTAFLRFMWPAELIVAIAIAIILSCRPESLLVAAPFLLVWAISPALAQWASRPNAPKRQLMTSEDILYARLISRRTWRFFEKFVGPENNWLPPDNFQEDPVPVISSRTSPTNIGLYLLSSVAAYDFGYIGSLELAVRLDLTFATLAKLPRYRGHFYNWYDTRNLAPLSPLYVSTVDSGNFAAHLIALKQACADVPDRLLFDARTIAGVNDIVALIINEIERHEATVSQRVPTDCVHRLRAELASCISLLARVPATLQDWVILFESLDRHTAIFQGLTVRLARQNDSDFDDLLYWSNALLRLVSSHRREFEVLLPWCASRHVVNIDSAIRLCSYKVKLMWEQFTRNYTQEVPTASCLVKVCEAAKEGLVMLRTQIQQCHSDPPNQDLLLKTLSELACAIEDASLAGACFMARLNELSQASDRIVKEMDFGFLFDPKRKVFSIGLNPEREEYDDYYYDLLASEARLASFIAVAKTDVPQEHWFRLARPLTIVRRNIALISWGGTMFEYLMPLIVMRDFDGSLLAESARAAVERHIEYAREQKIPWGMSESSCGGRDKHQNYQYGTFGAPGLGLKRGLNEDQVIAPYATLLAAIVKPHAAIDNLRRLESEGALGRYGYYEAIDYTARRLPHNQKNLIVRVFMAHHQGMGLVSLDNVINAGVMQDRFHNSPLVQATELLLQEHIPRTLEFMNIKFGRSSPNCHRNLC